MMKPVIFEMETSDPDDFLTLLWLADHPLVDLQAVLVTPGSHDQCQLVRWGLDQCGREDVVVGALHGTAWWDTADGRKPRVSGFHYKVYGEQLRDYRPGEVGRGPAVLAAFLDVNLVAVKGGHREPVTVLVGSPPKNLGAALDEEGADFSLPRWVQQGGFAGDNLVAPADRLEKFKGKLTCPSFNPGGAPKQMLALLGAPIGRRVLVSKNVCHGVVWNPALQVQMKARVALRHELARLEEANRSAPMMKARGADGIPEPFDIRLGLKLMMYGLDCYLRDKGTAKAMHDLVAAAVVVDESVVRLVEVEVYREKGDWGARAKEETGTFISVGIDHAKFLEVLSQ